MGWHKCHSKVRTLWFSRFFNAWDSHDNYTMVSRQSVSFSPALGVWSLNMFMSRRFMGKEWDGGGGVTEEVRTDEQPWENVYKYIVLAQINKNKQQNKVSINKHLIWVVYKVYYRSIANHFRIFLLHCATNFLEWNKDVDYGHSLAPCRWLPDLWRPKDGPQGESETGKCRNWIIKLAPREPTAALPTSALPFYT